MNTMKTAQQTQHTPGPWAAVTDPCPTTRNRWLVEKRCNGWKTFVAEVYGDPEHTGGTEWRGTREANARLIAAAPELLGALQTIAKEVECYCIPERSGVCGSCRARAAIAKATGQ